MITEDYVSFAVAKLLKEKGFDEICRYEYGVPDIDKGYVLQEFYKPIQNCELIDTAYTAPTHQMALKWLREVHNIFIQVDYIWSSKELYMYTFDIHNMKNACSIFSTYYGESFNSYEEAIEEAIKYCLINLIK